jgi:hypothetical protein
MYKYTVPCRTAPHRRANRSTWFPPGKTQWSDQKVCEIFPVRAVPHPLYIYIYIMYIYNIFISYMYIVYYMHIYIYIYI